MTDDKDSLRCYLCEGPVRDPDDCFCFGCGKYFCGECQENPEVPFGHHDPDEHEYQVYLDSLEDEDEDS